MAVMLPPHALPLSLPPFTETVLFALPLAHRALLIRRLRRRSRRKNASALSSSAQRARDSRRSQHLDQIL
jgi:hypothetical protein